MIIAGASALFNVFKLDFNQPFNGDSQIAVISIIAALCVVVLMCIMLTSLKIKEKSKA
ncbi:hypothetical protein JCM19294_285 [Nonlabens tegetincola]|uniref:Uncharacterized protein n=2 Tax=Nonlabens tegetincola TaxID=323273 RepID=A0A090QQG6_9FLAO|nr:hypothetical protein JCM19294_285 [Nonlabens tegetincola]